MESQRRRHGGRRWRDPRPVPAAHDVRRPLYGHCDRADFGHGIDDLYGWQHQGQVGFRQRLQLHRPGIPLLLHVRRHRRSNGHTYGRYNGQNESSNSGQSLLITANLNANTPNAAKVFVNWSNPNGLTITPSLTSRTICVAGFASGSRDLIGNYIGRPDKHGADFEQRRRTRRTRTRRRRSRSPDPTQSSAT